MQKLKAVLAALSHAFGVQEALHERAVAKMRKRHAGQEKAETQAKAARTKADTLRREANKAWTFGPDQDDARGERLWRRAIRKDKKAGQFDLKATREMHRAVFWRGRARVIAKRLAGIKTDSMKIEAEILKLGVTITGNRATGGTDFERWLAVQNASVANCAKGPPDGRRNFYSMSGAWNIDHPITPGEAYGERSDCSQTVTAWAKAAGLPDPNGADWSGGYTGTLQQGHNGWRQVSFAQMVKSRRPAFLVYGSGVGHHTEGWCPVVNDSGEIVNANRTAGHGSAPVDYGVPDLFHDGDFRCFIYDPK
jgi:hypothetical protein